jgi:YfiH family protein
MVNNIQFLQPTWSAPACIKAFTTLRYTNTGQEFSLALRDPDNAAIQENRAQLKHSLLLPSEPLWLQQQHTTMAVEVTAENNNVIADASFTHQTNSICTILTADCLPIFLCHREGTQVAAIHAGWRGLAGGVIESTLYAMRTPGHDLLAWLGPAIGPQKFEVGNEVYELFVAHDAHAASTFIPFTEKTWLADLYALARLRLQALGITDIYGGDYCTYSDAERFFSYRRDKEKAGRMAHLIWITDN